MQAVAYVCDTLNGKLHAASLYISLPLIASNKFRTEIYLFYKYGFR